MISLNSCSTTGRRIGPRKASSSADPRSSASSTKDVFSTATWRWGRSSCRRERPASCISSQERTCPNPTVKDWGNATKSPARAVAAPFSERRGKEGIVDDDDDDNDDERERAPFCEGENIYICDRWRESSPPLCVCARDAQNECVCKYCKKRKQKDEKDPPPRTR